MTHGLNPAEEPRSTEAADDPSLNDDPGFVGKWKIRKKGGGMQIDQIFRIDENMVDHFKIKPAPPGEDNIPEDWKAADLVLEDGKLKHTFDVEGKTDWEITLDQTGKLAKLHAEGTRRFLEEEPGEWEANEEDGP